MAEAPFVSIVVPVLNGENVVGDCLASLASLRYPPERREVVVVDNGSIDGTARLVKRYPVRFLRERGGGAGGARNAGVAASEGEIVAFVDADCRVTTGWLEALVAGFSDARVAAAAGEVVSMPPTTGAERYMAGRKPLWQKWTLAHATRAWLLTGNVALRRRAFDEVGPFDPRFAAVGCEDVDLGWRLMRAGLGIHHEPRAIVFHRHRLTSRSFLTQQVRIGRGQAALRRKYPDELPWGRSQELRAWRDLGSSASNLARALATGGGDREQAYFDLVRRLGQRAGFLRETLAGAGR